MKTRIFALTLVALMLLCMVSCDIQTKEAENGFSIELPFHYMDLNSLMAKSAPEIDMPESTCTYTSLIEGISVSAIKNVDYDGNPINMRDYPHYEDLSDDEIAYAIAEREITDFPEGKEFEVINGVPVIIQDISSQRTYTFFYVVDGCEWNVIFVCMKDADNLRDNIIKYAETIEIK